MAEENNTSEVDAPPSAPDSVQESDTPEATKPAEVAAAEPEPTSPPPTQAIEQASESSIPEEPDAIQPYIDKVRDNIKLTLEEPDIDKFLRAHIKTFREEWDGWSDNAKYAYTHMMTAQFLQRRAAATEIAIGNQFKLPNPSAQTRLMESIKRAITKPPKSRPALSVPVRLRPTSSQR